MRSIVAIITPWSCEGEEVVVEGDRIVFPLGNIDCKFLCPGDLARIEGFGKMGFRDGIGNTSGKIMSAKT